jgi:hypothetical protein
MKQQVELPMREPADARDAAAFVAELVRQGVTFKSRRDYAPHPSDLASMPVMVIEFTGGY